MARKVALDVNKSILQLKTQQFVSLIQSALKISCFAYQLTNISVTDWVIILTLQACSSSAAAAVSFVDGCSQLRTCSCEVHILTPYLALAAPSANSLLTLVPGQRTLHGTLRDERAGRTCNASPSAIKIGRKNGKRISTLVESKTFPKTTGAELSLERVETSSP